MLHQREEPHRFAVRLFPFHLIASLSHEIKQHVDVLTDGAEIVSSAAPASIVPGAAAHLRQELFLPHQNGVSDPLVFLYKGFQLLIFFYDTDVGQVLREGTGIEPVRLRVKVQRRQRVQRLIGVPHIGMPVIFFRRLLEASYPILGLADRLIVVEQRLSVIAIELVGVRIAVCIVLVLEGLDAFRPRGKVKPDAHRLRMGGQSCHDRHFQAPDTWYYAQNDGLLEKAYNEINEVIKAKNIDPDKVFVSGCSAGGYMTTRMLIAYPDLFAAAMINCPALDVADARGGETPTDAELASIKNSDTAIWLVQGKTDSSVKPEDCSIRLFNALTDGQELITSEHKQDLNSDFTTSETKDGKYKLSLYETVAVTDPSTGASSNKLEFAEDYDQDGVATLVQYSDHWSWIYTLNNNPKDAKGVSIMNWAAEYGKTAEQPTPAPVPETPADTPKTSVKTGDSVSLGLYAITTLAGLCGIALLKKRYN